MQTNHIGCMWFSWYASHHWENETHRSHCFCVNHIFREYKIWLTQKCLSLFVSLSYLSMIVHILISLLVCLYLSVYLSTHLDICLSSVFYSFNVLMYPGSMKQFHVLEWGSTHRTIHTPLLFLSLISDIYYTLQMISE